MCDVDGFMLVPHGRPLTTVVTPGGESAGGLHGSNGEKLDLSTHTLRLRQLEHPKRSSQSV